MHETPEGGVHGVSGFRMLGERTLVVLSSYQYNIYLDATDVLAWCLP